jgi:hypothetical protein
VEGRTLTESQTGTIGRLWGRWRIRAAVAVIGGAVLIAAGCLTVQYGRTADRLAAADSGTSPLASGPVLGPALTASASAAPSTGPSKAPVTPTPSAKASPKPAAHQPSGGWPGPGNTGVATGTQLDRYTGPCTVTADRTVITGKMIQCGTLSIRAHDVVIRDSKLLGILVATEATSFSFTMEDSEVDAGVYQGPAVGSTNMTIRRSNIHGGQTAVLCYANCNVQDSWLHGQRLPDGADWHLGGFLANDTGGSGQSDVVLVHNTIVCDSPSNSAEGGCSGNVNLFADFGPVSNVTVRDNFLGANEDISYCVYGGSTAGKQYTSGVKNIVFENNVFERGRNRKCGGYGPVTSFDSSRPGNRWQGNVWEDGSPVEAAN